MFLSSCFSKFLSFPGLAAQWPYGESTVLKDERDINVTSPTGIKNYKDLTGINLAVDFWDYLEKHYPNWKQKYDTKKIIEELIEYQK